MKVNLLNCADYVTSDVLPFKPDVFEDLNMEPILSVMSKKDKFVSQACKSILLAPSGDRKNILYRQQALKEALEHKKDIFSLYVTVAEVYTDLTNYRSRTKKEGNPLPAVRVMNSIETLDLLSTGLEKLKAVIVDANNRFEPGIFRDFFEAFLLEYDSSFMLLVHEKCQALRTLQVGGEIQLSGRIGRGMKCDDLLVNSITEYRVKRKFEKWDSLFGAKLRKNEIRISYDDLQLTRDCKDLESTGLLHVSSCFEDFNKDLSRLFENLRTQLAFFYGCCNLHTHMSGMAFGLCFPEIEEKAHAVEVTSVYDLPLAINTLRLPVTNKLVGADTKLYIITGVNDGGKTSFMRSVAIAQIMAQCGMFVPARKMTTSLFRGIYTHFVRNEDVTLNAGRLEEELSRLSRMIDVMPQGSMLFLNESFATTSENEGASIADDIIRALNDSDITVFFVTHIYAYAKKAFREKYEHTQFLQTERNEKNERTFRIVSGEPSMTGYGMELYRKIIGTE